jgi:hypothetical protein
MYNINNVGREALGDDPPPDPPWTRPSRHISLFSFIDFILFIVLVDKKCIYVTLWPLG